MEVSLIMYRTLSLSKSSHNILDENYENKKKVHYVLSQVSNTLSGVVILHQILFIGRPIGGFQNMPFEKMGRFVL